jgi:WD40 repeat protein
VATLEGHSGWVTSVAFHTTEPLLVTGGYDNTVKLWKIKNILHQLSLPQTTPGVKTSTASSNPSAYAQLPEGGSIICHHKKRSSRKLKRYASKRIKRNRNRNRNKYRKSKKAKTKRYPKLR